MLSCLSMSMFTYIQLFRMENFEVNICIFKSGTKRYLKFETCAVQCSIRTAVGKTMNVAMIYEDIILSIKKYGNEEIYFLRNFHF